MTVVIPTRLKTAESILKYVLGGKATITLVSNVTNKWITYKIGVCNSNSSVHFVWSKTRLGYRYVCTIKDGKFIYSNKKSLPRWHIEYKSFVWAWRHFINKSLPHDLVTYHHNTCSKCGRKLTTPKSIKLGIGPECLRQSNMKQMSLINK